LRILVGAILIYWARKACEKPPGVSDLLLTIFNLIFFKKKLEFGMYKTSQIMGKIK